MQLVEIEFKDNSYSFVFKKAVDDKQHLFSVHFESDWNFPIPNSESEEKGVTRSVFIRGIMTEFPYEPETNLMSQPLHIPNTDGRKMFKTCFDLFAKKTYAPCHIEAVQHPGYPLMVVTFDKTIIRERELLKLIYTIMEAIAKAEITEITEEFKNDIPEEEIDEISEENIIEFEEDEELKSLMKKPFTSSIQPLEGEDVYD